MATNMNDLQNRMEVVSTLMESPNPIPDNVRLFICETVNEAKARLEHLEQEDTTAI